MRLHLFETIIQRNHLEYRLIPSRRGRRQVGYDQTKFRKIEQDICFMIRQIRDALQKISHVAMFKIFIYFVVPMR